MSQTLTNPTVHPAWLRATHWLNVLAVLVMVMSGWQIYNASPIFPFSFPRSITLGGWLGGALLWHFAAMWVLALNGLIYLAWNIGSGRFRRQMFPLTPRAVLRDLVDALRGRLSHANLSQYNAVQKAAYLFVIADLVLLVLSGLVVFKPVQFPLLRTLMGDFDNARIVHFVAMALVVLIVAVHVAMVALVPKTFPTMITGKARRAS